MDKFAKRNQICQACKDNKPGADNVITVDITILGDTIQELKDNMDKFFDNGGLRIQFIDGICIEKNSPRTIVV